MTSLRVGLTAVVRTASFYARGIGATSGLHRSFAALRMTRVMGMG
jgi:hypothetical protein